MLNDDQPSFSFEKKEMKSSINVQGIDAGTAKGYIQHNIRNGEYEPLKEGAMEGIDPTKIRTNIVLKGYTDIDRYMKRILSKKKIQGGIQPNSHLFCSWVIHTGSSDNPLNEEQAIKYFEEVKKWIANEYGVLIVNAVIHLDEVGAPHMHIISSNCVEQNGKHYWSKSRVFGTNDVEKWSELPRTWEKMHQKIWEDLGKKYNFQKPGKSRGFKSQDDYKVARAKERFVEISSQQEILEAKAKKDNKLLIGCLNTNLIRIKRENPRIMKSIASELSSLKIFVKAYKNKSKTNIELGIKLFNVYQVFKTEMEKRELSSEFISVEEYAR